MTKRSNAPRSTAGARSVLAVALVMLGELGAPCLAHATEAIAVNLDEEAGPPAPKKPKREEEEPTVKHVVANYSLPWELRPVLPNSMVRSNNFFAFYGVDGATILSEITASYKFIPRISAMVKLVAAEDSPPTGQGGFGLANPLVGAQVGFWPAKSWKLGLFLGVTVPTGVGGGAPADKGGVDVIYAGMLARSGFQNPLFMPDYLAGWPGFDLAYVTHGLTVQAEVSMAFMTKVRGPQTEKSSNVDLTMGLHAGYFFFPWGSFGVDLRHQRWLTVPSFVLQDPTRELRDISTIGLGPRFLVKLSEDLTWRPGISMSFGLDHPVSSSHYKTVQIDLPFSF